MPKQKSRQSAEKQPPTSPIEGKTAQADSLPPPGAADGAADGAATPENGEGRSGWLWLAGAFAVGLGFFFLLPPLSHSGMWDPYELNVADLSRRIALNLHGASQLALEGTDNSLPHLNDLGRPQLPFTAIALGFSWLGLHDWAGRTPLALFGLFGVLATYGFVARLVDRRAALFSVVALASMPLYFVQSRWMLGDITTMSALAMAFGGLAVAVFDRGDDGSTALPMRLVWLGVAAFGLFLGFESRGGILGVAVPALGVGLTWAVVRASSDENASDVLGDVVAVVSLLLGTVAIYLAVRDFGRESQKDLSLWIGAMVRLQGKYPTFDYYIGHLGPALAPWSAFVPFAFGRLFTAPVGRTGVAFDRESRARLALIVGGSVAFVAHALLAPRTDLIPFCAPALLAAACGIALRDYDRGAHASIAVGVSTMMLLGVFHHDFHQLPEKAYQAFAVQGATFPEGFKEHALSLWTVVLIGFAGLAFFGWVERDAERKPFDAASYWGIVRGLRQAWDGLLWLGYGAAIAGAALAGGAVFFGMRTQATWLPQLSAPVREAVLNAWWVTALAPLGVIFGMYFLADVWHWAFSRPSKTLGWSSLTRGFEPFEDLYELVVKGEGQERVAAIAILVPLMVLALPVGLLLLLLKSGTRPLAATALAIPSSIVLFLAMGFLGDLLRGRRSAFIALSGGGAGLALCLFYYPALANQLSPKEVFESYRRLHKSGEALGLLGVGGRTAAYYAGGQPPTFQDANSAYRWMTQTAGERRFLAVKAEELPRLNQFHREGRTHDNVPVLDARSSQILLVASELPAGEKNENPLSRFVLPRDSTPAMQRKLDVNLEDKLLVLGLDVVDPAGKFQRTVSPGRKYHLRTYYKVLGPLGADWEAFIHIDGSRKRHNGDHKPLGGKYPMTYWLRDDVVMDDHEFVLEPNFTPGNYTIFFGFFTGDTRLKVKTGAHDGDNRINGGVLVVQ